MKKEILFLVFFISTLFTGCEEVVEVDLDTTAPKLVIEAAINWQKGTSGAQQTIKLTTTTGYFEDEIPMVSGATVYVKNSTNQQFNFTEVPNSGRYVCTNFKPVINETYTLTVMTNGSTYTASETLKSVTPITRIEQYNAGNIAGIVVRAFYNDPPDVENYYLYQYVYSNKKTSTCYANEDELYQGNEFFSISDQEDLKAGEEIEITHFGISKQYYNYMNILGSIAGSNIGGPFQTPPATVRGNIINTTDKSNYPLGYFSMSETVTKKYTVK
ncbi:DUF4249 domain-containing protein [Flavobacterium cheongpyeongense]|jgi:Domain of unknown function (DUF4249)|uniref:DUF4249 domain-containing protein n=1 Tax=Flavobacterium cheongpyeongense TaxID=2212651 RepID=A0A2V4BJ42_9FLAO|nr:DUF4249 domain-containing protein [Flavobacterium cheongpyeongense]PXY38955.1 DUF4249 domain-containing protein [Flavobacterium cheongpyeongense]